MEQTFRPPIFFVGRVLTLAEGCYLGQDGVPAAAVDGMLVARRPFGNCAIVSRRDFELGLIALFGELAGHGQVVFREIGYFGVVGVDNGVDEGLTGIDADYIAFYGDHFDTVESAFPDEGTAGFPIGKRLTAKHILFCLFGVGEGIPDFCCRSMDADRVGDNEGLSHRFVFCGTMIGQSRPKGLHFKEFF